MARPAKSMTDPNLLRAALEGLELQKERIEEQIRQVRSMLGGGRGRPPAATTVAARETAAKPSGRRPLSPAARKRIAAAQKRRWAEFRKNGAKAAKQD